MPHENYDGAKVNKRKNIFKNCCLPLWVLGRLSYNLWISHYFLFRHAIVCISLINYYTFGCSRRNTLISIKTSNSESNLVTFFFVVGYERYLAELQCEVATNHSSYYLNFYIITKLITSCIWSSVINILSMLK